MTLRALELDHTEPGRRFPNAPWQGRRTVGDAAADDELAAEDGGMFRTSALTGADGGVAA